MSWWSTLSQIWCFIVLVTADIGNYSAFLMASSEELPDNSAINNAISLTFDGELLDNSANLFSEVAGESANLHMEPFGESLQSFTTGPIASIQPDCISNGEPENLFISKLRPRVDACLPPLPLILGIYDTNTILNQLASPVTLPSIPDKTIPGTEKMTDRNWKKCSGFQIIFMTPTRKSKMIFAPKDWSEILNSECARREISVEIIFDCQGKIFIPRITFDFVCPQRSNLFCLWCIFDQLIDEMFNYPCSLSDWRLRDADKTLVLFRDFFWR